MKHRKFGSITVKQKDNLKLYKKLYYQIAVKPYRTKKPLQMKDRVRCPCCGMLSTPEKLKKPEAEPLEYLLQELRAGFKHHRAEHMISPILIKEKLTYIGKEISKKMLSFSIKFMTLEEIMKFLNIPTSTDPKISYTTGLTHKSLPTLTSKLNSSTNVNQTSKIGAISSPNYAEV